MAPKIVSRGRGWQGGRQSRDQTCLRANSRAGALCSHATFSPARAGCRSAWDEWMRRRAHRRRGCGGGLRLYPGPKEPYESQTGRHGAADERHSASQKRQAPARPGSVCRLHTQGWHEACDVGRRLSREGRRCFLGPAMMSEACHRHAPVPRDKLMREMRAPAAPEYPSRWRRDLLPWARPRSLPHPYRPSGRSRTRSTRW